MLLTGVAWVVPIGFQFFRFLSASSISSWLSCLGGISWHLKHFHELLVLVSLTSLSERNWTSSKAISGMKPPPRRAIKANSTVFQSFSFSRSGAMFNETYFQSNLSSETSVLTFDKFMGLIYDLKDTEKRLLHPFESLLFGFLFIRTSKLGGSTVRP